MLLHLNLISSHSQAMPRHAEALNLVVFVGGALQDVRWTPGLLDWSGRFSAGDEAAVACAVVASGAEGAREAIGHGGDAGPAGLLGGRAGAAQQLWVHQAMGLQSPCDAQRSAHHLTSSIIGSWITAAIPEGQSLAVLASEKAHGKQPR